MGRYDYAKNFPFMLDLIEQITKIDSNYILLQVGDSKYNEDLQTKVSERGLQKNIIFLGVRNDVLDIMQAMDIFILPSIYEGFPVVSVEAQACGLPCILSNNITKEARITSLVKYLSINNGTDEWIDNILNIESGYRQVYNKVVKSEGYDIKQVSKKLEKYYLLMYKKA